MSSLVLNGDTSGSVTVTVPAVAGTNTVTFPAATGTPLVSGNQPAFSAACNTSQSIPNATNTKVQLAVKNFDTANCFDNTTNYRFTPNVAGYYQFNAIVTIGGASSGIVTTQIWKNGTNISSSWMPMNGQYNGTTVSTLLYMNGSTDYVELYVYQNGGATQTVLGQTHTDYLTGVLVRAA